MAADMMQNSLSIDAQELAQLVSVFHISFAIAQIPVGVALDRYGARAVALVLLVIVTIGCLMAATLPGALGHGAAQAVLGIGCSGLLLCPMMFASRSVPPARFGLWSGLIMGVGGCGMLLSASPLAWLVEAAGWRFAFWVCCGITIVLFALTITLVPASKQAPSSHRLSLKTELKEVLRLSRSPALRAVMLMAFFSFAAVIMIRGLWGGPWLMTIKGMDRLHAGEVLSWFTVALIVGSFLSGMLDRWLGHRRLLIVASHIIAGFALLLLVVGNPDYLLPSWGETLGRWQYYDVCILMIFGLSIGMYPLLFAMTREAVSGAEAGKALAAVNLAFFVGTALLQSLSGVTVIAWGLSATLGLLGLALLACTSSFAYQTR